MTKKIGLDILTPSVALVSVAGQEIAVAPVRLRDLFRFLEAFAPVARIMSGSVLNPAAIDASLFDDMRRFVAVGAGLSDEEAEALGPIAIMQLVGAISEVNGDTLLDCVQRGGSQKEPEGDPWVDGIQALISAGHALEAIGGYTLAQYKAFLEAVAKAQKADFIKQVTAARMAQFDAKSYAAAMKELGKNG